MTSEIYCRYRHRVRRENGVERATCGLLQKLLLEPVEDPSGRCEVKRDACLVCSQSLPVTSDLVGGPFASILDNACEKILEGQSDPKGSPRASMLGDIAEEAILESGYARRLATCDVIVCCSRLTAEACRAIDSILSQERAEIIVHLVISAPEGRESGTHDAERFGQYASRYDVRIHRLPEVVCPLRAAHELAPRLSGEFVALQHHQAFSLPRRIDSAVSELRRLGADFIGSSLRTPSGDIAVSDAPGTHFESSIPWPTLVFRRASLIDLGGVADRKGDADVELLYRAHACGAKIVSLPWATVQMNQDWERPSCGEMPVYSMHFGSLRHHALGYPKASVSCDVVLPVFGQLEYVRSAIESVINQEGAEAVVHLIDDCGPEDVSDLFNYWQSHPQVRLYRNVRNLGQYTSFNNVSEFFETDFVAVQDGDDISHSHRLSVSGNLLELSGGDYFAATMEQFGESEELPNRRSCYPNRKIAGYFAMNPTACFRVSMFRSIGGYTDFGAHERNRGGLDTDFMNRAYYSERRFSLSSSIVTRRRVHPEAATQRSDTGFGSQLRNQAIIESRRRIALMQSSRIDPRFFGGLGNHRNLTTRLTQGPS